MALIHESKCGVCGAPRTTLDEKFFVTCAFCGSVMDVNVGEWFDPSKAHLDAARNLLGNSKMAARWRALTATVYGGAQEKSATYRADVEEYYYLYTFLFEDTVPKRDLVSVPARQAYAKRAAAQHVLVNTDSQVKPLWDKMLEASRAPMMHLDATPERLVVLVAAALEAATAAYAALAARPELAGGFLAPAKFYAHMSVRATLASIAPYFNAPGAVSQAMQEVFGDHPNAGRKCPHCGAPLEATPANAVQCAYCHSVIEQLAPA